MISLYMAMTVNGYIAKENNDTFWSDEEWENYREIVKRFGNLVIGKRTYEVMKEDNEFERIGNPVIAVVTSNISNLDSENFNFVDSPQAAVDFLNSKGFNEILAGGGGKLNSSFFES